MVNGGEIRGHEVGFVDSCCNFLVEDMGIGSLSHFVVQISLLKDPKHFECT